MCTKGRFKAFDSCLHTIHVCHLLQCAASVLPGVPVLCSYTVFSSCKVSQDPVPGYKSKAEWGIFVEVVYGEVAIIRTLVRCLTVFEVHGIGHHATIINFMHFFLTFMHRPATYSSGAKQPKRKHCNHCWGCSEYYNTIITFFFVQWGSHLRSVQAFFLESM